MLGTLDDVVAWGVALVLIAGACAKLADRADFALAVEAYEVVSERLVAAFALGFPLAELAAGLLLVPGYARPLGIVLALVVLGGATAAVLLNLRRGRRSIDCGCGGVSGRQPISWWLVARNAGLAVLLVGAWALPTPALDLAGLLGGAAAFVLLYAAADQLFANGLRQSALRRAA
jgi:hypothetical protein